MTMRTYLTTTWTMMTILLHLVMLSDTRVQCIGLVVDEKLSSDNGQSHSDGQTSVTETRTLSELLEEDTAPSRSRQDTAPSRSRQDTAPSRSRQGTAPSRSRQDTGPSRSRQDTAPSRSRQDTAPSRSRQDAAPSKSRKKRAILTWPPGSFFRVEFLLTIPISAPTGVSECLNQVESREFVLTDAIPFMLEVPYRFTLPNITAFDFLTRGHSQKDDRLSVYGVIEGLFEKFGVDGRACVLRAVCEHAQSHLLGAGILGDIISTVLAASSAMSSEEMYEYVSAELYGGRLGNCRSMYPTCPLSLFNWLD